MDMMPVVPRSGLAVLEGKLDEFGHFVLDLEGHLGGLGEGGEGLAFDAEVRGGFVDSSGWYGARR